MNAVKFFCLLALVSSVTVSSEVQAAECRYLRLATPHSRMTKIEFHSPNYPFHYPPNVCYMWYYSGKPGSVFILRVMHLDLPGEMGSCVPSNDSVVIGMEQQNILCGKFSELYQPEYRMQLTQESYSLYIVFNSTSNPHKGTGFYAEYFTLSPLNEPDQHHSATTTEMPRNKHCEYILTNTSSGHIPYQPITYRTVQRCQGIMTWLVVAPKPKIPFTHATITLEIDIGSCQKGLMNSEDIIEVFDGRNASMPLLIRYSKNGENLIGRHVTKSDSFFVRYHLAPTNPRGMCRLRFRRKAQCFENYMSCQNEDACFPPSGRCNGSWECPLQGWDERNCASTQCPPGKYSCDMNSHHCYEEKDRCNGKGTCTNYKDEMNCDPSKCNQEKGLFLCSNSRCIYEKWHCDGTNDCADNSDESGCGSLMTPLVIVAAVVGSLTCTLLMVIAFGCVCKVYRLRQLQLSGIAGPGGACCAAHGRHDSPLTRQLAEMFRQRAPPPPYHEAMITSRPYHEVFRESGEEGQEGASFEESRSRYNEREGGVLRDGGRGFRSLRRRDSDPGSERTGRGLQQQRNRRSRARRQHREVNQQDPAAHVNTGFIEVGALALLGSGLCQEPGEQHATEHLDPPPYSVSDPASAVSFEDRDGAAGSSSAEENEAGSDNVDAEGEEGMLLRPQRKTRRFRRNRVQERQAGVPNSCLEMSQVTNRTDHRMQLSSGRSLHPQLQDVSPTERNAGDCSSINNEALKREDETPCTSLSLSSATELQSAVSFNRESCQEQQMRGVIEDDSDSDCELLGEEDADDKDEEEEDDIDDAEEDEQLDPNFEEDSDDSDTSCLLSAV